MTGATYHCRQLPTHSSTIAAYAVDLAIEKMLDYLLLT